MFRQIAPVRLPTPRLSLQIALVMVLMSAMLIIAAMIALINITTFQEDLALVLGADRHRQN